MQGLLLINKPEDITSFKAVAMVRKAANTKKVGHTGTLDPLAEGVLIVCIGKATKIVELLTAEEKEAMTDEEVKLWEDKIKASLLRRDETLGSTISALHEIMNSGIEMKDGSTMYLFELGINNPGYFNAEQNYRNSFHRTYYDR